MQSFCEQNLRIHGRRKPWTVENQDKMHARTQNFWNPFDIAFCNNKKGKKCDHAAAEKSQAHHSKETVWRWSLKKVVLKNFVKFAVETPAMEFYF